MNFALQKGLLSLLHCHHGACILCGPEQGLVFLTMYTLPVDQSLSNRLMLFFFFSPWRQQTQNGLVISLGITEHENKNSIYGILKQM